MGLFNFFITLPQIINGLLGGPIVKWFFGSQAIYALVMSGVFLLIAAVSVIFVDDRDDRVKAPGRVERAVEAEPLETQG